MPRRTAPVISKDEVIDYKNLDVLVKCLNSQGQLLSRRRTGLDAQRQRVLKQAVKRARHMALLPFVG
ncbi:MAG: 30S ribosomal protein S18 [Planctomycetota bacterium]